MRSSRKVFCLKIEDVVIMSFCSYSHLMPMLHVHVRVLGRPYNGVRTPRETCVLSHRTCLLGTVVL
jgi:hypothetical protein